MCLEDKEHEKLLCKIEKHNGNLRELTKDSLELEPLRSSRRKASEPFEKIRAYAISLHRALGNGWSCTCNDPHSANLELEIRDSNSMPSFHLLFPSSASADLVWHETEVRPLGNADQRSRHGDAPMADAHGSDVSLSAPVTSKSPHASRFSHVKLDIGIPFRKSKHLEPSRKSGKKKVGWADKTHMSEVAIDDCREESQSPASDPAECPKNGIPSLCQALKELQKLDDETICLGRLHDQDNSLEVNVTRQPPSVRGTALKSLHDILLEDSRARRAGTRARSSCYMTRRQRLKIAVILASSILQLQTTQWIDSDWGREDILFRHGLPEQPYISKVFTRTVSKDGKPTESDEKLSCSPIRNKSLFKLGVLLLELSYGEPLHSLKSSEDPPIFTEYAIARRLVEELDGDEPSGYVDAARACIFCDFGTNVRGQSLNDQVFRQAVYDNVLVPLEEDWKHWNRRYV